MSLRLVTLHACALAALVGIAFAGTASAVQAHVHMNDEAANEVLDRGVKPENWMPILDGHIHLDAERGIVVIMYALRPGGDHFSGPVTLQTAAGSGCIETSDDPAIRVHLTECIGRLPHPRQ